MKLEMFAIVSRTMTVRDKLIEQIGAVETAERGLGVTIHGIYQDEAMLAVVRPVVLTELRARLASIDRDLVSYGVEL